MRISITCSFIMLVALALVGTGSDVHAVEQITYFHPNALGSPVAATDESGNILWRDNAPHFVDFDDTRMAPAVQDLWMMFSGERPRQLAQLDALLEGYREFNDFDPRELRLIEPLRTLRMLHYSAWLARRWGDPLFPHTFFWFNTTRYWGEHILELREQLAALAEPALEVQ